MTAPHTADVKTARAMISANVDAKKYFFAVATGVWIDWLDKNGFLNDVRKPAHDTSQIRYTLPELDYLVRVVRDVPEKVTEIALSVKFTADKFNPEVMDRLIWLTADLPTPCIARLVEKMRDDKWIYIMRRFINSGFTYERIITKLSESGDQKSLLTIAEALLLVRTSKEDAGASNAFGTLKPFYVSDMSDTSIFEHLAQTDGEYAEAALALVTRAMSQIVLAGGATSKKDGSVFKVEDSFYLLDVDFFNLEVGGRHSSDRDDVRNLAAVITTLANKTIGQYCGDDKKVRRLFDAHIDSLPDSRSMWRLRLFVLSLCPSTFEDQLKRAFFRLFTTERYFEIDTGAEYKKALKLSFGVLSKTDQRKYVADVFKFFSKQMENHTDQPWHKRNGWEILSSIATHLAPDEKKKCKEVFGRECDENFEPEPEIGRTRSGFVNERSPESLKDYSIETIIGKLTTDWAPAALKAKYKNDDFLNPRGAEGLGNELKEDLKTRISEYTEKSTAFFDRERISSYYTYSFIRAIEEMLRDGKTEGINWDQVYTLFGNIVASGEEKPFEREEKDTWRANWISVHDAIADVLLQTTGRGDKKAPYDFTLYRDRTFGILRYLFTIDDPNSENEKPEHGDLFHIAINSVRGRAFQVLVQFIYPDGEDFANDAPVKIHDDVKGLYQKIVQDDTGLSIRFVLGHYLASFYFRDKAWIRTLLPHIFPSDADKKDRYLAALEGYLASTLYGGLFEELVKYYARAIETRREDYTERKYTKDTDEALGTHIALAFMHFSDFGFESPLFKQFWKVPNVTRQKEFVSFVGRYSISRGEAGDEWFKEKEISKEKLMQFWDWALRQDGMEPEVFSGFGFWINPDKKIFDVSWLASHVAETLRRSGGDIDWNHALAKQLVNFAEVAPGETLKIVTRYFLDAKGEALNLHRKSWFQVDRDMKEVLTILYRNPSTKSGVYGLVNKLIEVGSTPFWGLEEILI